VAALNHLKGQVMKLSKGKANPNLVGEILVRKLGDGGANPDRPGN
jgi:aspartyl-tRNA(Asn)/glutamyl-tRNA(Gln) amidotransferase subunit B